MCYINFYYKKQLHCVPFSPHSSLCLKIFQLCTFFTVIIHCISPNLKDHSGRQKVIKEYAVIFWQDCWKNTKTFRVNSDHKRWDLSLPARTRNKVPDCKEEQVSYKRTKPCQSAFLLSRELTVRYCEFLPLKLIVSKAFCLPCSVAKWSSATVEREPWLWSDRWLLHDITGQNTKCSVGTFTTLAAFEMSTVL